MRSHEPLESDFWDALGMIREDKPLWVIIDGVDESTGSYQILAERLSGFLNRKSNYRVVLLGRSYVLTRTIETTKFSIDMSCDLNRKDINAFINAALQKDVILNETEITTRVSSTLQAKAGGMFLWAKLMIDHLSRAANKEEALKRLDDLPRGLEKAYAVVLSRLADNLDTRNLLFVQKVLEITVIARRSLTIEETRIALALIGETGTTYTQRLDVRLEQKISELCGSLIVVTDSHLNLVHFSLQELLTRHGNEPQNINDPALDLFQINTKGAHRALGLACLEYMASIDYGPQLNDPHSCSELYRENKFLNYALIYTISHLLCAKMSDLLSSLARFIQSENFFPWIELAVIMGYKSRWEETGPLDEMYEFMHYLDSELDGELLCPSDGGIVLHSDAWFNALSKQQPDSPKYRFFDAAQSLNERGRHRIQHMGKESISATVITFLLGLVCSCKKCREFPEADSSSESKRVWSSTTQKLTEKKILAREIPAFRFYQLLSSSSGFLALQRSEVISFEEEISTSIRLHEFLNNLVDQECSPAISSSLREFVNKSATLPIDHGREIANFLENWDDLQGALDVQLTLFSRIEQSNTSEQNRIALDIIEILCDQGNFEESETWCRRFVSQNTLVHGKEHELTLKWLCKLSNTLWQRHANEETRAIDRYLWEIRKRNLGDNHVETLLSARNLSTSIKDKVEAERLCRQTLNLREAHLGRKHADTLESYKDLLDHGVWKNADHETEKLYWGLLDIQRLQLGDDHEDTRATAWELAGHLKCMNKYASAEGLCLRLLEIERKVLGDTHEDTLRTVDLLVECFEEQQKCHAAEQLHRSLFRALHKAHSIGHHATLIAASKLVDALFVNENDKEAETIIRKILSTAPKIVALDSHWRKKFTFELGILLYRQEKWLEAERTFRDMILIPPSGLNGENIWGESYQLDEGVYFHLCDSVDSDESSEDKDEVCDSMWIMISDVVQELKYILRQQGKAEAADNIEFELGVQEQVKGSPAPDLWEDID